MENSTIVAQATANGKSGINIIRLSGKDSLKIARQIFCCKNFNNDVEPNFMYFGRINLGEVLDKGYCVYFKAPKSFTGEDIVEFHCHGGKIVAQKVLVKILNTNRTSNAKAKFTFNPIALSISDLNKV